MRPSSGPLRRLFDAAAPADDATRARARARARERSVHAFKAATLPSLIALPLIFVFRVPREWIEVAVVPAVVTLIGVPWVQAGAAWFAPRTRIDAPRTSVSIKTPLVAVMALLLIFQLVLRPGVRF